MVNVSVIVPVFNSEEFLEDCMTSLLSQTLDAIEIIAIDDASEDDSFEILNAFEKAYPDKVRVFHNEQNRGQGYSRNVGLREAKGKYIGFVDSDDYVHPNMFEEMYNGAVSENYPDVVTTGLKFVKDSSYLHKDLSYMNRRREKTYESLKNGSKLINNSPACWNKIFRSDTLEGVSFLEGRMWEDIAFTYTMLFNSNTVLSFNSTDYFYRKSSTGGVSARGFVLNSNLLDCFIVADALNVGVKQDRRAFFRDEIKFVQATSCLGRASEVLGWDIPEESKYKICYCISMLVKQKYGDWQLLDRGELSAKIGINNLVFLEKISRLGNVFQVTDFEGEIRSELQMLISNVPTSAGFGR